MDRTGRPSGVMHFLACKTKNDFIVVLKCKYLILNCLCDVLCKHVRFLVYPRLLDGQWNRGRWRRIPPSVPIQGAPATRIGMIWWRYLIRQDSVHPKKSFIKRRKMAGWNDERFMRFLGVGGVCRISVGGPADRRLTPFNNRLLDYENEGNFFLSSNGSSFNFAWRVRINYSKHCGSFKAVRGHKRTKASETKSDL